MVIKFSMHAPKPPYNAIVIVPVADLLGQPVNTIELNISTDLFYKNLPFAPCNHPANSTSCMRIHQALFHEIITVIKEEGEEVQIELPNAFYKVPNDPYRSNFWTLKRWLMPITQCKKLQFDLSKLPFPLSYKIKKGKPQSIVTLSKPFFEPTTQLLFSAGTRFVSSPAKKKSSNSYDVFILHPKKQTLLTTQIPSDYCIQTSWNKHDAVKNFVTILEQWVHQTDCIPYVWGGCSYSMRCSDQTFVKQEQGKKCFYTYPACHSTPKTGFDCAGMVLRAAQLAGIPYYFKNTITLAEHLQSLKKSELIENGDLIWFAGHVIVITDVKNNRCIEARDYGQGYGKVHETTIDKLFKGIKTLQDLVQAYHSHNPLKRLDHDGNIVQDIPSFKILKLKSAWNWCYEKH